MEVDVNKVDFTALKAALKEAGVAFGGRSGMGRLLQLAEENEVDVPLIGGAVLSAANGYDEEGPETDEDGQEEPETGEEEPVSRNVVPLKYRVKYGKDQHCGDEVALVLKEFSTVKGEKGTTVSLSALQEVAEKNSVDMAKWEHWLTLKNRNGGQNVGMIRMNLSNVLRGKINRGERVEIGERVWEERSEDAEQPLE